MSVNPAAMVAIVTVIRVGGVAGTVSVNYNTGGGNAVPGTDYTAESGVLTFNPGQTSQTIPIPILNIRRREDQAFALVLSNPTGGATLGTPDTLMVTICTVRPAKAASPAVMSNRTD